MTVQKVLVVLALCSVPVLLLGKPIHEYMTFKKKKRQTASRVCVQFIGNVCISVFFFDISQSCGSITGHEKSVIPVTVIML